MRFACRLSQLLSCASVAAAARSTSRRSLSSTSLLPPLAFAPTRRSSKNSNNNSQSLFHSSSLIKMSGGGGSDEVQKAKEAAELAADGSPPTIFDKLISGEWSSDKIHDDDKCMAFRDVNPQAPVHFLVIPKNRDGLTQLTKAREDQKELLGHLMYVAQMLGQKECPNGFRITINDGKDGAQSVYHLHLHVMGGRQMEWPPG